jgi:hypothetical protein
MVSKLDKLPKPADNVVAKQGAEPTAWRDVSIPMPNIEPIIKKLQSFIDPISCWPHRNDSSLHLCYC